MKLLNAILVSAAGVFGGGLRSKGFKLSLAGLAATFPSRSAVRAFPSYAQDGAVAEDPRTVALSSGTNDEFNHAKCGWMRAAGRGIRFSLWGRSISFSFFNDRINRVACPAMRFLTREGMMDDLFEVCGYNLDGEGDNVYGVDAESMKALIGEGIGGTGLRLRFDLIMTKKEGNRLSLSVLDRAFSGAIDGQAFDVGTSSITSILNVDQLEMNFDHSASSGIIGSATANGDQDNDSVNWEKFYEFAGSMCGCDATPLDSAILLNRRFSAADVGRAVNHFGQRIENRELMDSTDVGPFSWGILAFEWANTFVAFKKNGRLPYETFKKLFEPVDLDNVHIDRDEQTSEIWLGDIICAMGIKISSSVKGEMDAAHQINECPSDLSTLGDRKTKTQCKIHGLLTDICGDGYANCLEEGEHSACPQTDLVLGSSCTSDVQCSTNNCWGSSFRSKCVGGHQCGCVFQKFPSDVADSLPSLPSCNSGSSPSGRFLRDEGGSVIHYDEATNSIPREDVVDAVSSVLDGGSNFLLGVLDAERATTMLEVTPNGMKMSQTNNLTQAFWVRNEFLPGTPQIPFEIDCPPAVNDEGETNDTCDVVSSSSDSGSKGESIQETPFGTCLLKEKKEITEECLAKEYDLSLFVIEGPHFVLGATTDNSCPNLAFASTNGQKQIIKFEPEDVPSMQKDSVHSLVKTAKTSLGDIIDAANDAQPISTDDFDLEVNNCVHYAGSIWRQLEVSETHDLAQFIVNAISNDSNLESLAMEYTGGARYLAAKAAGGNRVLRYIEDMVYSQLIIA